MMVSCWSCGGWYNNAIYSWNCPHERLFTVPPLTDPDDTNLPLPDPPSQKES